MSLNRLLFMSDAQINWCVSLSVSKLFPLLLLTFLPFTCGCQNACNIFRVGFLSKKKRNLALIRTQ